MSRRSLSHFLISIAVFVLTATVFIWIIDGRVLNNDILSDELRKAGVSQELSDIIPEIATTEAKDNLQKNMPLVVQNNLEEQVSNSEEQLIKDTIKKVVTAEYVETKISVISASIITFVREGEPNPIIDLSDFPEEVKKSVGAEQINTADLDEQFAKPIQLNEQGDLDNVHSIYKIFSLMKYVGLGLFVLIMLIEWFVAEKGKKLQRISRVFLYAGMWFALYWGLIVLVPYVFGDALRSSVQGEFDASGLIDAVVKAVQGLFAGYFLTFAVGFLSVAFVLYLIRHFMHGDVLVTENTSPPAGSMRTNK